MRDLDREVAVSTPAANRASIGDADAHINPEPDGGGVGLDPAELLATLSPAGGVLTGVPCSSLKTLIAAASSAPSWRYVPATSEGEAVAIAAGIAALEGSAVLVLQNSGLPHAVEPLTSLVLPFGIPLLLVIGHRGGAADEQLPHHEVMGRVTKPLLDLIGIEHVALDAGLSAVAARWRRCAATRSPLAVVSSPGLLGSAAAEPTPLRRRRGEEPHRTVGSPRAGNWSATAPEAIAAIRSRLRAPAAIVSTTGHTSRYLFASGDSDTNVYLEGSMGYASAFALGIALRRSDVDVVVLDGDGAALMHAGNLATVGAFAGPRYRHLILDNGAMVSTGSQPTASPNVSFVALAEAFGYAVAADGLDFATLDDAVKWLLDAEGPALLRLETHAPAGSAPPRVAVGPRRQIERLRRRLETPTQTRSTAPAPTTTAPPALIALIERTARRGPMPFRCVGAHDALSARLGEDAGFDGIWVGSLEVSASHGVPDTGCLPLAETVERVREIAGAVTSPVLVDAENGGADIVATVAELEAAGAAGIVLEDKSAPRFNSLIDAPHRLQSVDAYCEGLEAALTTRRNRTFAVIARVEALTSGEGVDAAVARAEAYAGAGADAVVVHSRSDDGSDVVDVLRRLALDVPLGVIPTTYYERGAAVLRARGASFVIYANHGLRAEIEALRRVFAQIYDTGSSESVENTIASLSDVLELHANELPVR